MCETKKDGKFRLNYMIEIVDSLKVGKGWTFICGHHPRFRPESDCRNKQRFIEAADKGQYGLLIKHFDGKKFREIAVVKKELDG